MAQAQHDDRKNLAPLELVADAAYVVVHPRFLTDRFDEAVARLADAVSPARIHEELGGHIQLLERHVKLHRLWAGHSWVTLDDVDHRGCFGVFDVLQG